MCGINGFNYHNKEQIIAMNHAISHRGPDGTDFFCDELVSLGHNLLAITEAADMSLQPVVSKDGLYALVYNGEIYNYSTLREELKGAHCEFQTNSDTEVLFHGLRLYGIDFIKKLDGMFALCWYDKKKEKMYLARDASGMKPLYYKHDGSLFVFSSEIKALLTHPSITAHCNQEALGVYFALGYVPGRETLFKGIHKVRPGECVTFNLNTKNCSHTWYVSLKRTKSVSYNPSTLHSLFAKSTHQHTMGLRPFGLYLSGGLDSTVILHELTAHIPEKIKTFTTRFDVQNDAINEDAEYAKRLCNDYAIEHHELLVTERDYINAIEKTIYTIEEPRYNFSLPAYYLLSQYVHDDIVVALLGNGGDELFLGYDRYLESKKITKRLQQYPGWMVNARNTYRAYKDNKITFPSYLNLNTLVDRWAYLNSINRLSHIQKRTLFNFPFENSFEALRHTLKTYDHPAFTEPLPDLENALGEIDRLFWLADEDFLRSDKILMRFGLEGRFPFLAQSIITYANSISSDIKLQGGVSKFLLRDTYTNKLPEYILRKRKTGWYAPTDEWMHSDFGAMVKEVLSSSYYSKSSSLFDFDAIHKNFLHKDAKYTKADLKKFLPIFFFQIWAHQYSVSF